MQVIMRECPRCGKIKLTSEFTLYNRGRKYINCKTCDRQCRQPADTSSNPRARRILNRIRISAMKRGIENTLSVDDIPLPNTCKYFGTVLNYGMAYEPNENKDNSASVDRIDNSKGYVPGNIQVISLLANRMKQYATIEQLLAFAVGVLKVHQPTNLDALLC